MIARGVLAKSTASAEPIPTGRQKRPAGHDLIQISERSAGVDILPALLIRKVETWMTAYIRSSSSAARRRRAIEDAIQTAVSRAAQSLKNLRWCEVVQTRGHIEGGKVQHYQVALKIGFIVNDVRAE